jgi:hypothetical protein
MARKTQAQPQPPLFWACLEGCNKAATNLATGTFRVCRWVPQNLREEEIVRRIQPTGQQIYERWSVEIKRG